MWINVRRKLNGGSSGGSNGGLLSRGNIKLRGNSFDVLFYQTLISNFSPASDVTTRKVKSFSDFPLLTFASIFLNYYVNFFHLISRRPRERRKFSRKHREKCNYVRWISSVCYHCLYENKSEILACFVFSRSTNLFAVRAVVCTVSLQTITWHSKYVLFIPWILRTSQKLQATHFKSPLLFSSKCNIRQNKNVLPFYLYFNFAAIFLRIFNLASVLLNKKHLWCFKTFKMIYNKTKARNHS